MAGGIDLGAGLREIVAESTRQGVDPYAAIAVAKQEGLGGGVGDSGTSFGPFQLHIGGAYPASAPHESQQAAQEWAWSPAGIDYAVGRIADVSRGQTGSAAVRSIVNQFERPADPQAEYNSAFSFYQQLQRAQPPIVSGGQLAPGAVGVISTGGSAGAGILGLGVYPPSAATVNAAATHIPGVAQVESAAGAVSSVGDALKFVFSYRMLEIVGGLGLIGLGIAGLVRSQPVTKVLVDLGDRRASNQGGPRQSREGVGGGGSYTLEADRKPPRRESSTPDTYGEVPF